MNRILTGGKGRVEFDEPTHKYTYDKTQYISGTTLLGLLKPDKDWKAIAENYAKKHGGTAEFWRSEWDKEADKGKAKGTLFHNGREQNILEQGGLISHGEYQPVRMHNQLVNLHDLKPGVYTELRLWCHFAKIAGTADLVIIHEDYTVSIYDWKTNKQIKKGYNYIDKRTGTKIVNSYLKEPCSDMVDCEYSNYALQLSLYAWMMEIEGFVIRNLAFIHITDGNKVYHCPYMPNRIKRIVEWYVC